MKTRNRRLKLWNGKVFDGKLSDFNINVAATSQSKAAKLVAEACDSKLSLNEFRKMYSNVWGTDMSGIVPQEPCVFATKENESPQRIL